MLLSDLKTGENGVVVRVAGHGGLEGGPDLPTRQLDMVELKILVVGAAHVSLHMAGVGLHAHHAALQEGLVVTDGVQRGHHGVFRSLVGKNAHLHFLVENLPDSLVTLACVFQPVVALRFPYRSPENSFCLLFGQVDKRGVFHPFEMIEKHGLQIVAHMLFHGILGMFLHPGVVVSLFSSVGMAQEEVSRLRFEAQLESRIRAKLEADYKLVHSFFDEAYICYPSIPRGVLEWFKRHIL